MLSFCNGNKRGQYPVELEKPDAYRQGPRSKFSSGGGLKDKQVKMSQLGGGGGVRGYVPPKSFDFNSSQMPRNAFKTLINEILKYKLSVLKKRCRLTKWYSPLKN